MEIYEFISPCHFGMEAVLNREIYDLGYDVVKTEDGRVTFEGDAEAVCRANINLRTTERVLLKVGEFHAETFDELFEAVKALPWERYLPEDARFWAAKASSVKSKLFSPSDIQSIVKKAIVERLKASYGISWFQETGASYPLRVFLNKDQVTIGLDTSGDSLHKRGYRVLSSKAPITETLAAAMILLTPMSASAVSWGDVVSGLRTKGSYTDGKLTATKDGDTYTITGGQIDDYVAISSGIFGKDGKFYVNGVQMDELNIEPKEGKY